MPQVDLETLVSVCGGGGGADRKIACETQVDGEEAPEVPDVPDVPPDFPPESFWLSKDAEYDWFDRNAFYERKDSTKGNSHSANLNPNLHPPSNSSSQRFSMNLKSKASIIGLPKTQKTSYVDSKRRNCKTANIRLFPKRSGSMGKTTVSVTEPSSPKVSCMGRVRSKRSRRRSAEPSAEAAKEKVKKAEKTRTGGEIKKIGFCGGFISMFRTGRREKPSFERDEVDVKAQSPPRRSVMREISGEPVAEPPGLGGMMRFASGRRSTSWSVDDVDLDATRSGPFHRDDRMV